MSAMTNKSVPEINEEHGRNAAGILTGYQDATDEIRAETELKEGAYLDELTAEQRMSILRQRKSARADDAYRKTFAAYTAEVERYHSELARRGAYLKKRLYEVEGSEGAAALSRTVLASEEELAAYLDVAIQATNEPLAKAVFVAAARRGLGDLLARYFDEVDPEARDLYSEAEQMPPTEVIVRQRENVERIVQPPDYDRLIPPARATT